MNIDKNLIGKSPNVAVVINEQIIEKAESYKQEDEQESLIINGDTREKLEASAEELTADFAIGGAFDVLYGGIIGLLDRQATITERELCGRCSPYATAKDYMDTIESLTAERDELSHAVDKLRNQVDSLEEEAESHKRTANRLHNEVEYLEGQLAKLTAERDELRVECDMLCKVKDRLKRENGEFKDRNHELESAFERMDELLTEKQRVIDIQRESFKRLEYEITVLKKKGAM